MISIGTDCSGIEAPVHALKQLNIPYAHKWSCEIDKYARASIEANTKPDMIYSDITKRDHNELPCVDIYVAGFPCQPFSIIGLKNGINDIRSNIMIECIKTISINRPKIFILENVKNFKYIQKGEVFNFLIDELNKLEIYNVYYDILNTKDYSIPQNRERIFIIGINKDIQIEEYKTPDKKSMNSINDYIIDKTICNIKVYKSLLTNLEKIDFKENYIITPFKFYSASIEYCPTLTTNCNLLYHTTYKRHLTVHECLKLQGFDDFVQVVSNTQMYKQIGNSMSVNVLKELFKHLFKITVYKYII